MNNLAKEVERLNGILAIRFKAAKFIGLCIQVVRNNGETSELLIKSVDDDSSAILPDDSYSTYVYHRLIDDETFDNPIGKGSGNTYSVISPMTMVVHTDDICNADKLLQWLQRESNIVLVSRSLDFAGIATREFGTLDKYNYEKFHLLEIRYNLIHTT